MTTKSKILAGLLLLIAGHTSLLAQEINFSGKWLINKSKVNWGQAPEHVLPRRFSITQNKTGIEAERVLLDENLREHPRKESLKFGGTTTGVKSFTGNLNTFTLQWNADKKTFTEHIITSSPEGKQLNETNENWSLADNGKTLVIEKKTKQSDGLEYTLVAYYDKVTKFPDPSLDPVVKYDADKKKFEAGKLPAKEAGPFANMAAKMGERETALNAARFYIDNYLLTLPRETLYADKNNLQFMLGYTASPQDKAFEFFNKDSVKINEAISPYTAQKRIIGLIENKEVKSALKEQGENIDWKALENKLAQQYGPLGRLAVLQEEFLHDVNGKHWQAYDKSYVQYFDNIGPYCMIDVNNCTWPLFQYSTNQDVLKYAATVMEKYELTEDPMHIDTYANLLYKTGDKEKAIQWEDKAVQKDQVIADQQKREPNADYLKTLQKMKQGLPTWPEANDQKN